MTWSTPCVLSLCLLLSTLSHGLAQEANCIEETNTRSRIAADSDTGSPSIDSTATAYCHGVFKAVGAVTRPAPALTLGAVLKQAGGMRKLAQERLVIRVVSPEDQQTRVYYIHASDLYQGDYDYRLPDSSHIIATEPCFGLVRKVPYDELKELEAAYFERMESGDLTLLDASEIPAKTTKN